MFSRMRMPSPALVLAFVALFAALVGGALAAKKAPKNSVVSKSIKKFAVKNSDIAPNAVTGDKVVEGSLDSPVPDSDKLGGQAASFYAPATILRTATIAANGTLDPAHSDGVSQANVSKPITGLYCIGGLSPAPRTAVATLTDGSAPATRLVISYDPGGQCAGNQISVAPNDAANNILDKSFSIFIR
jgi:hypothetical protein